MIHLPCQNLLAEETVGCKRYCNQQLSVDSLVWIISRGQQKYNGFSFSKK